MSSEFRRNRRHADIVNNIRLNVIIMRNERRHLLAQNKRKERQDQDIFCQCNISCIFRLHSIVLNLKRDVNKIIIMMYITIKKMIGRYNSCNRINIELDFAQDDNTIKPHSIAVLTLICMQLFYNKNLGHENCCLYFVHDEK